MTLLTKLLQADVVCRDCGMKYGKYSVGCSSTWESTCDVCDQKKPVTEVRDWGYLGRGIQELKGNIKEQSKEVAERMLTLENTRCPMPEDEETLSYTLGDIACCFTEDEVEFLY